MVLLKPPLIPAMLGLTVQGDLGGFTFYTSARGKIVWYPQAPPLDPPSYDQTHFRNLFKAAGASWQGMSLASKRAWTYAAKATSLTITGYNLYTYWLTTRDTPTIRTIERQAHIDLLNERGDAAI